MRHASSLVGVLLLVWGVGACGGGKSGGTPPNGGEPPTPPLSVFPNDRRVSRNVDTAAEYPVVTAWDRKVYVVWEDGRLDATNVYFNRSLDGGATWDPTDTRVDHTFDVLLGAFDLQIACEDDLVVVVWSDDRNGGEDVFLNRSVDGGITWQNADTRLDTDVPGAAASGQPVLAVTEGRVYVAWTDDRGSSNSIRFSASHDGGENWPVSDVQIDEDGLGTITSWQPAITAHGPNVCVAWRDDRFNTMSGNFDLRSRVSLDGGEVWEPLATLNTSPAGTVNAKQPSLRRSGPQALFAVWSDDRVQGPSGPASNVYTNRSGAGGTGWASPDTPLTQSTAAVGVGAPQLCSYLARVFVVWGEVPSSPSPNVVVRARRKLDEAVVWQATETDLATPPGLLHSLYGPVCESTSAHVFVAWADDRAPSGRDVYLNHAAWQAPFASSDVRLNVPPAGATNVSQPVIATGDGAAYVVWHDDRGGANAVYMNTARP